MNKFLFFLLFLAVTLGYLFDLDQVIARNFNPFNGIKQFYVETIVSVQTKTERYFNQTTQIESLQKENEELKNYKLQYLNSKNKLDNLLDTLDAPNSTTEQIKFTRVLSYVNFDNFTKVWLDLEKKDNSILGVISQEFAAGIVVNQDGKAKALLNGNEKCNYSIFIGENKAPGIIHATKDRQNLVAKYIPIWFDIKEGDEVITSGMDNIFFEGLKVGKVISIKKKQDIQEAIITPYAKVLKQKSFFVYKKIQNKKIKVKNLVIKDTKKEEDSKKKPTK
ncbi:rod shape-determining protein MreC [Arcobacter sp. LA11]|uniref:rod shape-determining protein MreC n=1 Tax=Arcobacter sp. LA11 TaxID=1898176 RepID=UPI0009339199|nr:rod shape-determining protein MreC [Arcobacter sp. LA11]